MNLLRKVDVPFYLKTNHSEVIAEVHSLEELLNSLLRAPLEAVSFHLREGKNDFATWVKTIIYDIKLAERLRKIKLEDAKKTHRKIIRLLKDRIEELQVEVIVKEKTEEMSEITGRKKLRRKIQKSLLEQAMEKQKNKQVQ